MLGYLATAILACSFGFVLGGLVAGNKAAEIYERLTISERGLAEQAIVVKKLASAIHHLLDVSETHTAASDTQAIAMARAALASCDDRISEPDRFPLAAAERRI